MERMPLPGSTWFITVKIDFLISPAYSVPPISTMFSAKFTRMKVEVRVPSTAGSALKLIASRTTNPGSNRASLAGSVSRTNMFEAKSDCQAVSVITRTGRR